MLLNFQVVLLKKCVSLFKNKMICVNGKIFKRQQVEKMYKYFEKKLINLYILNHSKSLLEY